VTNASNLLSEFIISKCRHCWACVEQELRPVKFLFVFDRFQLRLMSRAVSHIVCSLRNSTNMACLSFIVFERGWKNWCC
jgi:hypothetical protein